VNPGNEPKSSAAQGRLPALDLNGVWLAGYPGGPLEVTINQKQQAVVATLVTGNEYVPAGKVTFQGTHSSNPFSAKQICAYSGFGDAHWVNVRINVIDNDHFIEELDDSQACVGFPVKWERKKVAALACPSGPSVLLFSNTNTQAVTNGPGGRPAFNLSTNACITQVVTYHWNNARGAMPGKISIQQAPSSGPIVGTFQAKGTSGQNNVPNANWVANIRPSLVLTPNSYSVIDSDDATWSRNAQSAFRGFVEVYGTCADGSTDCAKRPVFKISPPDLRGQWVCSGPCQRPGGIESITGVGPSLTLINEVGQRSTAYFSDPATIVAREWGGLNGKLSPDGRVITWANNTVWTRSGGSGGTGGSSGAGPVFPPGPAPKPVACTLNGFQFDCYGQVIDVSPKPVVLGGSLTLTVNPKSGYSFDGKTVIILQQIPGVGVGVVLRTLCGGSRGGAPNTPCPLSGPKSMTLSLPNDGSIPTGYYILRAENLETANVVGGAGVSTPKSTKADSDQVKFIK
jgi:hypothetical protein